MPQVLWVPMTITPELMADLRKRVALWRSQAVTVGHISPDDVTALLDCMVDLESQLSDMTTVANGRFRELQDAQDREKSLEAEVAELKACAWGGT